MRHLDPAAGRALGLRLARQEEQALEDAYSTYAPTVLSYVSRYVGRDEAEDVMQRTFLDAWRHAGRYDPSQRFTGGSSRSPTAAPWTRCARDATRWSTWTAW